MSKLSSVVIVVSLISVSIITVGVTISVVSLTIGVTVGSTVGVTVGLLDSLIGRVKELLLDDPVLYLVKFPCALVLNCARLFLIGPERIGIENDLLRGGYAERDVEMSSTLNYLAIS